MLNLKSNFPIFSNNKNLIYLDNAATSQKPKLVIEVLKNFYKKENANINRGVYPLSELATKNYEEARKKIAEFIGAGEKEIVFTKNTTESINLLSYTLLPLISDGKNEILLTEMEHHSNLVPWQQFAKRNNLKLKFIPINEKFELDYEKAKQLISNKTAILAVTHVSNILGTVNNVDKLVKLTKGRNVLTVIDAAQSVAHLKINVKDLDCDFLAFSSHKMFGPMGVGILYGKKELLKKLPPFLFGGGMIKKVSYENAEWADIPEKFEAGTQNIGEAIALGKAIDYIEKIGFEKIHQHEKEITQYALKKLKEVSSIKIYAPKIENQSAIISFNLDGIHPHDVASILAEKNICVRAGHHCGMPLLEKLNALDGTIRISFSIYNTKTDIDMLVQELKKIEEKFKE